MLVDLILFASMSLVHHFYSLIISTVVFVNIKFVDVLSSHSQMVTLKQSY